MSCRRQFNHNVVDFDLYVLIELNLLLSHEEEEEDEREAGLK